MKQIVICDLDGTLADCEHRQHHVRGPGKKNWKKFFDEMYADPVVTDLNLVLQSLHRSFDIYFVSARPDNYRNLTEAWLYDQANWKPNGDDIQLIMREAGDFRADTVVKQEIYDRIKQEGHIIIAFDDRKSVVDMWRSNGVLCAQVQDHDF